MRLSQRRLLDDVLVCEEPCLGAIFLTYAFDPRFFEEQVLRTVLRLRSDPEDQSSMFHEEARRALQDTPVAVVVDASARQAGRRLPYDLLLVRSRCFHPKLVLALYENHATLLVGSHNLTRGGYGDNLELSFVRRLDYSSPADAATLQDVDRFIASCADLAQHRGTLLDSVRQAAARRIPGNLPLLSERDVELVDSFRAPILEQLLGRVPDDARITQVGVLAPFYERDDADAAGEGGIASLLLSLAARSRSPNLAIDLGTGWNDSPVAPPAAVVGSLDAGLGALWAWRSFDETDGERCERIGYVTPTAAHAKTVSLRDATGRTRRVDRAVVDEAIEERRLWPVPPPVLPLPRRIIGHLSTAHNVQLWMHPAAQLDGRNRVRRQPLHAKLFLVSTRHRGRERTLMLVGSPNASRAAMLRSVEDGGNVELGVLTLHEGTVRLLDVLPSLVVAESGRAELVEQQWPESDPDLSAWIRDAVHAAAARSITIEWASEGPAPLHHWSIGYEGKELLQGDGVPSARSVIAPFDLLPASAELRFVAEGREHFVPIRVADLAELPTHPHLCDLDLRELLALLGRRVGAERLTSVLEARGAHGADALLESVLGPDFGPVDVFKAWWGLAYDLEQPLSVSALRHRLNGPLGVHVIWQRLEAESGRGVGADEVWVYGCELVRTLSRIALPPGPDRDAKQELLAATCHELAGRVRAARPAMEGRAWLGAVAQFYDQGERDA